MSPGGIEGAAAGLTVSAPGAGHLASGAGCQDAARLERIDDRRWAFAVADGAGSAPLGGEGASLAVEAAIRSLVTSGVAPEDDAWRVVLSKALIAAHVESRYRARALGREQSDFSATLMLGVVAPTGYMVAQVGDGVLVVEHEDASLETVLRDRKQGPVNVSAFVTDTTFLRQSRYARDTRPLAGVFATTDGLEGLATTPDGRPFGGFILPLLRRVRDNRVEDARREIEELLTSDRLRAATDDDVTVLIVRL
ncbi:MAG: PP2C family serine/threonine-protein phosphatase [Lacipirellulaceae bacterium]